MDDKKFDLDFFEISKIDNPIKIKGKNNDTDNDPTWPPKPPPIKKPKPPAKPKIRNI